MDIRFTKSFEADYRKLPHKIQGWLDKQLLRLLENPRHPSLRTKKMEGYPGMWEGHITKQWRFTFTIYEDAYFMRRVGTHDVLLKP